MRYPGASIQHILNGLLLAGGYGTAWLALYEAGQWGVMVGGAWPWFVPAALRLTAFLMVPVLYLPLLIATELLVSAVWAHWFLVTPSGAVLMRHLALPLGTALVALAWRAAPGHGGRVDGLRGALLLLAAMILAPAASAVSGTLAAAAEIPSVGFSSALFSVYFVEELAAIATFTPALLVLGGRVAAPSGLSDRPLFDTVGHACGVLLLCITLYVGFSVLGVTSAVATAGFLLPPAWSALRFGLPGAALAVAVANTLLVLTVQSGPPAQGGNLILLAGVGLLLGVVVSTLTTRLRWRQPAWIGRLIPVLLLAAMAVPALAHAEHRTYRVVTLAFQSDDYDSFRSFRRRLVEDGLSVEFIARTLGGDIRRMPAMIEEIRALRPDLVYTQNTTMVTALAGRGGTPDPARFLTAVAGVVSVVSDPVGAGLVAVPADPAKPMLSRRNVTGTVHVLDEATLLRGLLAYRPTDRVAVLYDGSEPSNLWRVEDLKIAAKRLRITLDLVPFRTGRAPAKPDQLTWLLERIATRRPDIVYLIPNAGLAPHLKAVFREADRLRLPTFCALETYMNAGCMAGVMPPLAELGRQTAEIALQVLRGQAEPGDIPIVGPSRFGYVINLPVALRQGAYPSVQILNIARLVDRPPAQ